MSTLRKNIIALFILIIILTQFSITNSNSISMESKDIPTTEIVGKNTYLNDANQLLANTPQAFTENRGQLENDEVRFYDQSGGFWFTDDGVWMEIKESIELGQFTCINSPALENPLASPKSRVQSRESRLEIDDWRLETEESRSVILKQAFVGANQVTPIGEERLSWNSNFFYGNDSSQWRSNVHNFLEIYYENLYDGIDLKYYTNGNGLKYDFIVHPGADASQIRIKYEGAEALELDIFGNLIIKTMVRTVMDANPVIYQTIAGTKFDVYGEFILYDNIEFGFEISDDYNEQEILVIDPFLELEYSTFIGGNSFDSGNDITIDANGFIYVIGSTDSSDFPITPGANDTSFNDDFDCFVLKLYPNGSTLVYSTFVGGKEKDRAWSAAMDSTGNIYVTGPTDSASFPTTPGANDTSFNGGFEDIFVFKLNHNGSSLIYSTFIGGDSWDIGRAIALDLSGNAFVMGRTRSLNFPTTTGAYETSFNGGDNDIFVFKLNQSGSRLLYSTFVGGSNSDGSGYGVYVQDGIAVDLGGNAYVTSHTNSSDFPTTPGAFDEIYNSGGPYDAVVFKLNENGDELLYSTYIGGDNFEYGQHIALDAAGNALVVGYTNSTNFPTTQGAYDTTYNNGKHDSFVLKLNHNGSALIYSTFIGGSEGDNIFSITFDQSNNIYLTGDTWSSDFPTTPGAYDRSFNGRDNRTDAIVLKLNTNASKLLYSTFIGGNYYESGIDMAIDQTENVFVTGSTQSTDFPTTPGAFSRSINSLRMDIFIAKFSFRRDFNITSVSLLKNNTSINEIYSRLCPYTLRINVTNTDSQSDIGIVRLNLDPLNTNIQLLWERATGRFSKVFDPYNYIALDDSSNAYYDSYYNWTIDFNVTFNWTYPDEDFHDVQAYALNNLSSSVWLNKTNLYRVENDLVFNGTLSVNGESNQTVANGSLVRGGEKFNWTGLTPVYEGTVNTFPPENEFDITLWDENDDFLLGSPVLGQPLYFETIAPDITKSSFNYTINLTGIPKDCDKTNTTFTIRIDGDNLTFSNPRPDNEVWQRNSEVFVGITIKEIGGGVVNGSSIMYCISMDNSTTWGDWKDVDDFNNAASITVQKFVFVEDGNDNLIKWCAADSVGNGPVESDPYQILVDTKDVIFSNASPLITEESPTEEVEVDITISDNTSGVDASTIKYTVSYDAGENWDYWKSVPESIDGNIINVKLNLTFHNGTDNRIKWRAYDVAGNGPVISDEFIIRVNRILQPVTPEIRLIAPENNSIVSTSFIELSWKLDNIGLIGVTYDYYLDTIYPPMVIKESGLSNTNLIIDDLIDGKTYYWTIIPKVGKNTGSCISGIWSFTVNIPNPSVTLISPANGSTISSRTPTLIWSLEYGGSEKVKYEVYFENKIEPKLLHNGYPNTYFSPQTILEKYTTYYWRIVPNASGIKGPPTEIWSFTVEEEYYSSHFELKLELEPAVIELMPDEKKFVKAIVTNLGNLTNTISLRIWVPPDARVGAMINEPNIMEASPRGTAEFDIMVMAFEDAEQDEISLRVVAISETAVEHNTTAVKETTLIVKINVIDMDTEKPEKDISSSLEGNWYFLFIVIIIILILIVLAIIIIRRRHNEQKLPSSEVGNVKSEKTLIPEIISEQVPAVSTPAPPGTVPAIAGYTPQLAASATTTPVPVPKLVKSTQSTSESVPQEAGSTQAPQHLPQLPPATATESEPIPQIEMPPENVTPVVEAPVMETELQRPSAELLQNAYVQTEPKPLPQVQETQSSMAPTIEPIQSTQNEQTPQEESQSMQQKLCSTCNQSLTFYSQNNKYYCYQCQKYM